MTTGIGNTSDSACMPLYGAASSSAYHHGGLQRPDRSKSQIHADPPKQHEAPHPAMRNSREMPVQPRRQHVKLLPLQARPPRNKGRARFDKVHEPPSCPDRLREIALLLAIRDRRCGAEEGGTIVDLLRGETEEVVEGLGRNGGVAEGDVDGEIGADVVVCSPCDDDEAVRRMVGRWD